MNNIKSYIPIAFSLIVLIVGSFGVYRIYTYVSTFSVRVVDMNTKIQTLEQEKKNTELFKKILSKGSVEQEQIDTYILSGDSVFGAITSIEKDGISAGLFGSDSLGIISVEKRENADLDNKNAGEVVVTITAESDPIRIDAYIAALSNLGFVSHIEKIVVSNTDRKTRATITLIITELL